MTASTAAPEVTASLSRTVEVRPALRRLAGAAWRYAEARQIAWTDQLRGVAEPSGATDHAVVDGLRAWATDGSPAQAALRGAWVGADGKTKAAIVAILLLLAVLAPVLLLLGLLALLVAAAVRKAGRTGT